MISHIPRHQDVLMGWTIEVPLLCERYWVPCFRGAVDGWHSHIFHRKCDNLGPTLTIARKDSYLFGGFADKSWKSKSSIIYLSQGGAHDLAKFRVPMIHRFMTSHPVADLLLCFRAKHKDGRPMPFGFLVVFTHRLTELCILNAENVEKVSSRPLKQMSSPNKEDLVLF